MPATGLDPDPGSFNSRPYTIVFSVLQPAALQHGAGIAQSVQRLSTGWPAEGSEFEYRQGEDFSFLHVVQSGSGTHPTSYPMGIGEPSPVVKRPGREADH
jgi:hypothetical protein